MARKTKNLVGLDIDPAGISAAQVSVNGRISIDRAAFIPLDPGIVRDGEVQDVEALSAALRALYSENRGLSKHVRLGLANQKIVVRVIELPYVADAKQFATAVRFVAQEQLPMPLETAVLDYQLLDQITTDAGMRQRVLVVAARRDVVTRMLGAVRNAGLRPEGLDLSAFAMVRALYSAADEEEHILYLAIGGLTNLAVAKGTTCVFTRASAGGLESLSIDLAERCKLTLEHARGWLRHVGLELALDDVEGDDEIVVATRNVLIDGVRHIAADVRNSLDFYQAQEAAFPVARVVLTGPAADIPGFGATLAADLGLPVEEGLVAGAPEGIEAGTLTVAAGLAVEEVSA